MIDHLSIGVRDIVASTRFYEAVLAALGYKKLEQRERTVGFGKTYGEFWLNHRPDMGQVDPNSGTHICLRARSRAQIEAFHRAALAEGGTSDGEPGPRNNYGDGYFAAFIRDPDGHRIEAVTFLRGTPEEKNA